MKRDGRISVTGARGMVGRRVVARLVARGLDNITCVTRQWGTPGDSKCPVGGLGNGAIQLYCTPIFCSAMSVLRHQRARRVSCHLGAGGERNPILTRCLDSVVATRRSPGCVPSQWVSGTARLRS